MADNKNIKSNEFFWTYDTLLPIVEITGYNPGNLVTALTSVPNRFEKIHLKAIIIEKNLVSTSFTKSQFKCYYEPFQSISPDGTSYPIEIAEAGFNLIEPLTFNTASGELTLEIDPTLSFTTTNDPNNYINTLYNTDGVYTIIVEGGGIIDAAENQNGVAVGNDFVWKKSTQSPQISFCAQNITGRYINEGDITSDASLDIKINFTFKDLSVNTTSNFSAIQLISGHIITHNCAISNFVLLPAPSAPIKNKSYLVTFTSVNEGKNIITIPGNVVQDAMGNWNEGKSFEWIFSTGGVLQILPYDLKIEVDQNPGIPLEILNIQTSIVDGENITISGISVSDTLRIREDAWNVHHGHKSIRTNSNSVIKRAFAIKKLANLEKKI